MFGARDISFLLDLCLLLYSWVLILSKKLFIYKKNVYIIVNLYQRIVYIVENSRSQLLDILILKDIYLRIACMYDVKEYFSHYIFYKNLIHILSEIIIKRL